MKRKFVEKKFQSKTYAVINTANKIIKNYQSQGLKLTLRQLYYQFVANHGLANTEKSYKQLQSIVSDARLAGLIDWEAIEDRGRRPEIPRQWESIRSVVNAVLHSYRKDRWRNQGSYVELWVEKQALAGVLEPLAEEFHVTLMVNKGYSSQSAMYDAAQRYLYAGSSREPVLLYLGDHDPSGEDMVRDIEDRLRMFGVSNINVEKVALTMDQVEFYKPIPNPAKRTDSRFSKYRDKFGDESWEVDALEPDTLQKLIRNCFMQHLDTKEMELVKIEEEFDKIELEKATKEISNNGYIKNIEKNSKKQFDDFYLAVNNIRSKMIDDGIYFNIGISENDVIIIFDKEKYEECEISESYEKELSALGQIKTRIKGLEAGEEKKLEYENENHVWIGKNEWEEEQW